MSAYKLTRIISGFNSVKDELELCFTFATLAAMKYAAGNRNFVLNEPEYRSLVSVRPDW
jgi:hypothetical protein